MKITIFTAYAILIATVLHTTRGYSGYQSQIPNGVRVPNPCPGGGIWQGVGHQSPAGANARNPFGLDFYREGKRWTKSLCRKDSDGDGLTNGQELGDPECVWKPGAVPQRTTGLSHPGICPLDSKTCTNAWTVCPKAFSCPAMSEPGVIVRNFTIQKNTPVPAKETTYMCQAFELNNTATPMHLVGSLPIIVNKEVMHHMIIYSCSIKPEQALFDGPNECFMGRKECTELLNLWAYGIEGECFNTNAGFRIGGEGYRYGLLEVHWNNPGKRTGYTDSSGFSVYLTPNLRKYDQATVMYGETNLVLPPQTPTISFNHTCPSVCTKKYHSETRYITSAAIHMHTYGVQGRISLWRNGTLIKDLSPLQVYDYNSPQIIMFNPPIEYLMGDEVKTECYFNTMRSNYTIFFGEGTSDEMCLSFLSYYPSNVTVPANDRLATCLATSGINHCWLRSGITPQVERECNITGMIYGDIPYQVLRDMNASGCFSKSGCVPTCRKYLENSLYPNNACYDPKRSLAMTEAMITVFSFMNALVRSAIYQTLSGLRYCEPEIKRMEELNRLQAASAGVTTAPSVATAAPGSSGLTSEHLLIVILVCSCLGFVLLLAVLALIASRLNGSGTPAGQDDVFSQSDPKLSYKVYDNDVAKD